MDINDIKQIDRGAKTLWTNIGAFPLYHPLRDMNFMPGVKYVMESDDWMDSQPTIVATTDEEDLTEVVKKPKEPRNPEVDRKTGEPVKK